MFGRAAPKHVYSAYFANSGASSRTLTVVYTKPDSSTESVTKEVKAGATVYFEQKTVPMDGYSATARISSVSVKGAATTLQEPFEGVISPTKDYHFTVDGTGAIKGSLKKK